MLCVSSVDALITYYETLKRRRDAGEHDLRVATIFTYTANEEDADADGMISDPDFNIGVDKPINVHIRRRSAAFGVAWTAFTG